MADPTPSNFDQFKADVRSRTGASDADVLDLWYQHTHGGPTVTELKPKAEPNPALDAFYEGPKKNPLDDFYAKDTAAAPPPANPSLDAFYEPTAIAPQPTPQARVGPAPVAPTAPPVSPTGAAYPEKSGLDQFVGQTARGFYDYTKAITGPFYQLGKLAAYDIPDWWLQNLQHKLNPEVPAATSPITKMIQGIGQTIQNHPTDLLGRSAQGIREEGWTYPFTSPGHMGEAVGDTAANLAMFGPLVQGGRLVRLGVPAKVAGAIDRGVGYVIPKYNFTDPALAVEASKEGQYLKGSANTEQLTRQAQTLMANEPGAAPLLEPKIFAGKAEMNKFQRQYDKNQMLGPAGGWVPFDYRSRKLELTVDQEGRISYLRAPEFNALPPVEQARITNIRNAIDTNTATLNNLGIVTDSKAIPGYLAKQYSAFETPRQWGKTLETTSGQMAVAQAKAYISRKTGITSNEVLNETIQQILDPKFKEAWQTQRYNSPSFGTWSQYAQNLAKRKNLPPEIEAILGPMERAEQMPYRVGYTLDAQLKLLTNHQMLDRLSTLPANDGRPLLYSGVPRYAGYVEIPKSEVFGQWGGAHLHPDVADILPTIEGRTTNNFLAKYMTAWKASKTSWSPSTHLNNTLGDVIFAHLAGTNPLNPLNTKYYVQAVNELTSYLKDTSRIPSVAMNEALSYGGIRPGFAGTELQQLANKIRGLGPEQTVAEAALGVMTENRVAQKLRDVYDAEDQVFRYAAYLKHRDLGMSPMQASAEVNKYFPSYATSSEVGRYLRGQGHWTGQVLGSPFTSFPMEAMRIYATAAREKPWRLSAVGALPLTLTNVNLGNAGISPQDWHSLQDRMPSQMRGRTLVPMVGPDGQVEVADWSNIMPLGNWAQGGEGLADQGPARDTLVGGPFWNAFKIAFNTDLAGHKMYDPSRGDDWKDMTRMLVQQAAPLPQWTINALPLGTSRVEKSLAGTPPRRYAPEEETMPQAAWRTMFPNLDAKNISELEAQAHASQKADIGEAKKGKKSVIRNPSTPSSEKERKIPNVIEELSSRRSK